jgi:hypothetical protein
MDKICYSCSSGRNSSNEPIYDQTMEYDHLNFKMKCPNCNYKIDISDNILITDVYICPDHIVTIYNSDKLISDKIIDHLYDVINNHNSSLSKICLIEPGKYLLHIFHESVNKQTYDAIKNPIEEVLYKELIESYNAPCSHCNDEYIRTEMYKGIIYGYNTYNPRSNIDKHFLLCKKCFNELKLFTG